MTKKKRLRTQIITKKSQLVHLFPSASVPTNVVSHPINSHLLYRQNKPCLDKSYIRRERKTSCNRAGVRDLGREEKEEGIRINITVLCFKFQEASST